MKNVKRSRRGKWSVVSMFVAVFLVVSMQAGIANAGIFSNSWGPKMKKMKQSDIITAARQSTMQSKINADSIAAEEQSLSASSVTPLATSTVPKLFWVDCGLEGPDDNDMCTGTLWYVDPAAVPPTPMKFASNVVVYAKDYEEDNLDEHLITTGEIEFINYQVSDLKIGYVFYFQGGKIWLVDTTTLVKKQISNESGITASSLCRMSVFESIHNSANATINYRLRGSDGFCRTGDDVNRAVKISMSATTTPINVGNRNVMELLFDNRYIVEDGSTGTHKIQICNSNIANCSDITTRQNTSIWWWTEDFDAQRIVFYLDGKWMIYNYTSNTLTTLYTPASNEQIYGGELDRDGYFYFAVTKTSSPFNSIMRVPVTGGAPVTLASFGTAPAAFIEVEISPSYVTYFYPNPSFSALLVRSVPKTGGTSVELSGAFVTGGVIGDYLAIETTAGQVQTVHLNGSGRITRSNAQLNGRTLGGSGDWNYLFNPATARFFVSDIANKVKSYAYDDNISLSTTGTLVGTLPVNLSNVHMMGLENNLLGIATRRHGWFSWGNDLVFLKADTATSLKRMTNTNATKIPVIWE